MIKPRFIADLGSNTNNDTIRCREMISELKKLGFWGAKVQVFQGDKMYHDKSLAEVATKRQLDMRILPGIANYCEDFDIRFGATPFHEEAVDQIRPYIDFIKISSFDAQRDGLIRKCIKEGGAPELIISLGLSDDEVFKINYLSG